MSESRLILKHPTGFFAAGGEMLGALALLSDGGFKLYVYLCFQADRRTAEVQFSMEELAHSIGHTKRSLTAYLKELEQTEVGLVHRASNQHQVGRIEIQDRFWPYKKQTTDSSNQEQAFFITQVRARFLKPACVNATFSAADERLSIGWYKSGFTLDQVDLAIVMGCARKYVALLTHPNGSRITSLQYFAGLIQEVAHMAPNPDYLHHLNIKMRKMELQFRAHANFASPTATVAARSAQTETK